VTGQDLRGAARLAAEATAGLVDLVEAVHAGIARVPGLAAAPADGRTRGITGLVYRSVRGVTRLVGGGVDTLLALLARDLAPGAAPPEAPPARAALQAALNGVLGDHLDATANPLATPMTLRHGGQPLPLQPGALQARLPAAQPAIALLLHGLCMDDRAWPPAVHTWLAEAGFTPLALRYNSGRAIARNGAELARLLEALQAAWPVPPTRLVLLGHSMGGLVARSALHQAQQQGLAWPGLVTDLFFLGTPHHGAPLEKLGHVADRVLAATPYAAPFARLGRLRSAGITDLRHGRLLDGADAPVPLPQGVRCHAVAGQLGESADVGVAMHRRLVGDGLVTVASALGRHRDPARALHLDPARTWVGAGIGHLALLSDPAVLAQLRAWLPPAGAPDQSATASR
jgi:hypothetical protein